MTSGDPLLESGNVMKSRESKNSSTHLWNLKILPKANMFDCGQSRQNLRNEYNAKEISSAQMMDRYDKDKNGMLDPSELKLMLQDYNGGMKLKEEEAAWIMLVADINKDGHLQIKEVHSALRVWYAYKNMCHNTIEAAMRKHKVEAGTMPQHEALKLVLEELNETLAVRDEEVSFVESAIRFLSAGAQKETISHDDIKRALACWYLHIQRGQTSFWQKLKNAHTAVNRKMSDMNVARKLREGECDFRARGTLIIMAVVVVVVVFVPLMHMMVGSTYKTNPNCEQPVLSSMIWWTGCLGFAQACCLLNALLVSYLCPNRQTVLLVVWGMFAVLVVIETTLYVVGISIVTYTTAGRCGGTLWHYTHFAYVVLPVIIATLICCGLPILYCYLGSEEFIAQTQYDEQLGATAV